MANFVAQTPDNSPKRCLDLAVAVNATLRGDTANIGRLACAAGANSVTVRDKRCRAGQLEPLQRRKTSVTPENVKFFTRHLFCIFLLASYANIFLLGIIS